MGKDPFWAFDLPLLVAWLETQDPAETYDYNDPEKCLLFKYVTAKGGRYEFPCFLFEGCRLDMVAHHPAVRLAAATPHTLGAALERGRAALAERALA